MAKRVSGYEMSGFGGFVPLRVYMNRDDGSYELENEEQARIFEEGIEAEDAELSKYGMGLSVRPAKDDAEARRWEQAQRLRGEELSQRNQALSRERNRRTPATLVDVTGADGKTERRAVPTAELPGYLKQVKADGGRAEPLMTYRARGVIGDDGALHDVPGIDLVLNKQDPNVRDMLSYLHENKLGGYLEPGMMEYLGIDRAALERGALVSQAQAERYDEALKRKGKMGASEAEGARRMFGRMTLSEANQGEGTFGKALNYFNAALNPFGGIANERAEATIDRLASEDGLDELRKREEAGEPLLSGFEKGLLGLGFSGDLPEGLNRADELWGYLRSLRADRLRGEHEEGLRGTTFGADVVRATADSARMGGEFALMNVLTPGFGNAVAAGGLKKAGMYAVGATAQALLHGGAKADALMADRVQYDSGTGELTWVGKGAGRAEAMAKGYSSAALEYLGEMATMDVLKAGYKTLVPSRSQKAIGRFVGKVKGSKAAQAMDRIAANPTMDAMRKVRQYTGLNLSFSGMLEESIGEEMPANIISSLFNLERTSGELAAERKAVNAERVARGERALSDAEFTTLDVWGAAIDTLKAAPSMAVSVALMGAGQGVAVRSAQGLYNYGVSGKRMREALRELGVKESELKGMSKAQMNDRFFEEMRTRGGVVAVYDADEIGQMGRGELVSKAQELGILSDQKDADGMTEAELRDGILRFYKGLGGNAITQRAMGALMRGMVVQGGKALQAHGNIMDRLEADVFGGEAANGFSADEREGMREVMLLRSMAGSNLYDGTLYGQLLEVMAEAEEAKLGDGARAALARFEGKFGRVGDVPFKRDGKRQWEESSFRQPMSSSDFNNGEYVDSNSGIRISSIADGDGKTRVRVDADGAVVHSGGMVDALDAELADLGLTYRNVLPFGEVNEFGTLAEARAFAREVSAWNNTRKRALVDKAKVAQRMYERIRGEGSARDGLVLLDSIYNAPSAIQDEVMEALKAAHPLEDERMAMARAVSVNGFTSAQDGKAYVFLDQVDSPYAMLATVQHEGLHQGLMDGFLGDRKRVDAFLSELTRDRALPKWFADGVKRARNLRDVEELLANAAETLNAGPGLFSRVSRALKRATGLNGLEMSDADVERVVFSAWKSRRVTDGSLGVLPEKRSGLFETVRQAAEGLKQEPGENEPGAQEAGATDNTEQASDAEADGAAQAPVANNKQVSETSNGASGAGVGAQTSGEQQVKQAAQAEGTSTPQAGGEADKNPARARKRNVVRGNEDLLTDEDEEADEAPEQVAKPDAAPQEVAKTTQEVGKTTQEVGKTAQETGKTSQETLDSQHEEAKLDERVKKSDDGNRAIDGLDYLSRVDDYMSLYGNVLSADSLRRHLPGYVPDDYKTHIDKTGVVGEAFNRVFDRLLETRANRGNGEVVFLAGGNGVGKSTISDGVKGVADFIVDSTFGNFEASSKLIERVLEKGLKPRVLFVYRDPFETMQYVANRVKEGGHIVSPVSFANSHTKPLEVVKKIVSHFGDRVDVRFFYNSSDGTSREVSFDELPTIQEGDYERIREAAKNAFVPREVEDGSKGRRTGAVGTQERGGGVSQENRKGGKRKTKSEQSVAVVAEEAKQPASSELLNAQSEQALMDLLGEVGLLREGKQFKFDNEARGKRSPGMLREGGGARLSDEASDKLINNLPKVFRTIVDSDARVRTFEQLAERIYRTLQANGKVGAWEALKPYLQGAWNTVGNLRSELGLDDISRKDSQEVLSRIERGSGMIGQRKEQDNARAAIQSGSGEGRGSVHQGEVSAGERPAGGDLNGNGQRGDGQRNANAPARRDDVPARLGSDQPVAGNAVGNGKPNEGGGDAPQGAVAGSNHAGDGAVPAGGSGLRGNGGVREGGDTARPVDGGQRNGGRAGEAGGAPNVAQAPAVVGEAAKPQGAKQSETKPSEAKPAETKQAETKPTEKAPENKKPVESVPPSANYVIPDDGSDGGITALRGKKAHYAANVNAIKVLKRLEAEGRLLRPTVEEQAALSLYAGWGGLAEAFDSTKEAWADEYAELKGLLSETEYNAARRGTQYAHYTPIPVIRGIYDALVQGVGLKGSGLTAYEAGVGVGHFIGALPDGLRGTQYVGVDVDPMTAKIAQALYPHARISNIGFQSVKLDDGSVDFIVGNPPFSDTKLTDVDKRYAGMSMHNHFIAKQIDALKPGGVAAFVVSRYFMDGKRMDTREYIHKRAAFLGAVRLPGETFAGIAGTKVVTDIVFFRKRLDGEAVPKRGETGAEWLDVMPWQAKDANGNAFGSSATVNKWFSNRVEQKVLGRMRVGEHGRYGGGSLEVDAIGDVAGERGIVALRGEIAQAAGEMLKQAGKPFDPQTRRGNGATDGIDAAAQAEIAGKLIGGFDHPSVMAGSYFNGSDGKLYAKRLNSVGDAVAVAVREDFTSDDLKHEKASFSGKGSFKRWYHVKDAHLRLTAQEGRIVRAINDLRNIRYDLAALEQQEGASDDLLKHKRTALNSAYQAFLKAAEGYGNNSPRGSKVTYLSDSAIAMLMENDPAFSQVLGLEYPKRAAKVDGEADGQRAVRAGTIIGMTLSPIFERRVSKPKAELKTHYDDVNEAMLASLGMRGKIDLDWMTQVTGKSEEAVLDELGEHAFINPNNGAFEIGAHYLSGDVKTKLEEARRADGGSGRFERNIQALEKVIPKDIPAEDLLVSINSPYVPQAQVERFFRGALGIDHVRAFYAKESGKWIVSTAGYLNNRDAELIKMLSGVRIGVEKFLQAVMDGIPPRILKSIGDGKFELDSAATDNAREQYERVREMWEGWWKSDAKAVREISAAYNERVNRYADPVYDGSFLRFDGLNSVYTLNKHQRDAVARTVMTGRTLFNHVVGSGKTLTTICSIMEMRRMGLVNKPIVAVPNQITEQWRQDFLKAYPAANVLCASEDEMKDSNRRKALYSRIQNGDYDAIILPHSMLSRLPLSPQMEEFYLEKQIASFRASKSEISANSTNKRTITNIEARVQKFEERLNKLRETPQDNTGLYFDTLGFDGFFLDEAHIFKNVPFVCSQQVAGMGNPSGSKQALDLLMKMDYMREFKAGSPTVFMTGTPISNSLTEIYTNMRLMAPDLLENAGIKTMDNFLNQFCEMTEEAEFDATGQMRIRKRLRRIVNAGDLMTMIRSYMDVVQYDDLERSMAAVGKRYNVPKVEGDGPQTITAERSPEQEEYFGKPAKMGQAREREGIVAGIKVTNIISRAEDVRDRKVDKRIDNMLKITSDAKAASLDMRLLFPNAPDFAGSKVNLCVGEVMKVYRDYADVKGTQIIWCDLSTPKSSMGEVKKELGARREFIKKLEEAAKKAEAEGKSIFEVDSVGEKDADGNSVNEGESLGEQIDRVRGDISALETKITSGFSVYDDIKEKLVSQGVKPSEVAFVHDYDTKAKKAMLNEKMNRGDIRVLIGSTGKMGTGMNVQERLVAMHHLDCPWKPAELEQRNGRIIRQGNKLYDADPEHFRVKIKNYVTKATNDAAMYQTILNKQLSFSSLYKADRFTRSVDDVWTPQARSAEEMMAEASGSKLLPLRAQMGKQTNELRRKRDSFDAKRVRLESGVYENETELEALERSFEQEQNLHDMAQEKPDNSKNKYAGFELLFRNEAPKTFEFKTFKERVQQAQPLVDLLRGMRDDGRVRYRGMTAKIATRTNGELFDQNNNAERYKMDYRFEFLGQDGKAIGYSTWTQYPENNSSIDESFFGKLNRAIDGFIGEKWEETKSKREKQIDDTRKTIALQQGELDNMPKENPYAAEYERKSKEFEDLMDVTNANAINAVEAQEMLRKKYEEAGKPVPEYKWASPSEKEVAQYNQELEEENAKNGNAPGMLREAAAVPADEYDRWNNLLDSYRAGRLSLDKPIVVLRRTPEIIARAIDLAYGDRINHKNPIHIRVEALDKITSENIYTETGKHNVPLDDLRNLQLELDNPVAIFVSQTHPDTSLIVLTELVDMANNKKAIVTLQYAYHPNGDYAVLKPCNANRISSIYARNESEINFAPLYVNTTKAGSLEGSTRLQLPFHRNPRKSSPADVILTEKDFSMSDKGMIQNGDQIFNPQNGKNVGLPREPAYERIVRERLKMRGIDESQLPQDEKAVLDAYRAHQEAMPKGAIGRAKDGLKQFNERLPGETTEAWRARKLQEAKDWLATVAVDATTPLRRAVEQITGGRKLDDDEDIAKAMQLSYGKVAERHREIEQQYTSKIMHILAKNGLDVPTLDVYLTAKFAPERNAMILERAEWKDAGSGMTDETAESQLRGLKDTLGDAKFAELERAAEVVYQMNRDNLDGMADAGVLSRDQVAEWKRLSPHYVPLREDMSRLGLDDVQGTSLAGEPYKRAVGRFTEMTSSTLGWSILQAMQGVILQEQNYINNVALNFCKQNASDEDYRISVLPKRVERVFKTKGVLGFSMDRAVPLMESRASDKQIIDAMEKQGYTVVREGNGSDIVWVDARELDAKMAVRKMPDYSKARNRQTVVARVNGRRVYILFNPQVGSRGNKMGMAITKANVHHWDNPVWNMVVGATRIKAAMSTIFSPTFAVRNAVADLANTIAIMSTEMKGKELGRVLKNYGGALSEYAKFRKSGQFNDNTLLGRYLKEAMQEGLLTGIYANSTYEKNMAEHVLKPFKEMQHRIGMEQNAFSLDTLAYGWDKLKSGTQIFSEIPEVGIRLAVYSAMRESGMSISDATVYAREITVDFNKKGTVTPITNVLYMFSNAGIQAMARYLKAAKTGGAKGALLGAMLFTSIGFFGRLWNRMLVEALFGGGDDDDDEAWKNIPDYISDRGLPIVLPGGKYLEVPTRGIQSAFLLMGQKLYDIAIAKDEDPATAVYDIVRGPLAENINFVGNSGSFWQAVSPTTLDPVVQLIENKSWTGQRLHSVDYGNSAAPKYGYARKNTSPAYVWLSKFFSDMSGGDEVEGGAFNVYPEELALVGQFFTSTVGVDIEKLGSFVSGDFSTRNVPILRGFVRPIPDNTNRYFNAKMDFNAKLKNYKSYLNIDKARADKYYEDNPVLRNAEPLKNLQREIERLTKVKARMAANGIEDERVNEAILSVRRKFMEFYEAGKMSK